MRYGELRPAPEAAAGIFGQHYSCGAERMLSRRSVQIQNSCRLFLRSSENVVSWRNAIRRSAHESRACPAFAFLVPISGQPEIDGREAAGFFVEPRRIFLALSAASVASVTKRVSCKSPENHLY